MPRKRRTYSPEFKAEAVRLVKSSAESLPTIAKELGVSDVALRHWVAGMRPPSAEPLTPDERSELKQLRRDLRRLREERDILKKATAFFAKHSE
jgi:transposase